MSKALVAVKRVIDYNARVRIKPDKVSPLDLELFRTRHGPDVFSFRRRALTSPT